MTARNQTPKRVALLGATGTVGRATAVSLARAGHEVLTVGRSRSDAPNHRHLSLEDMPALQAALTTFDAQVVVSCIASRTGLPADAYAVDRDANLRLMRAAQAAGVDHFVLLSAICVQKPRLAFQHAKLEFENQLQASGLRFSIVRPTALFKSLSGQVARVQAGKPYLLFGDGRLTACKPISDHDLGEYITSCISDPRLHNRILPIGGPGPALTPYEMGRTLFEQLGQPARFRRISPKVITAIGGAFALAGRLSPRAADKAELARIGSYYATESMLVWDSAEHRYDADATPETGQDRLFDYYRDLLSGKAQVDLGAHAVF